MLLTNDDVGHLNASTTYPSPEAIGFAQQCTFYGVMGEGQKQWTQRSYNVNGKKKTNEYKEVI